MSVRIDVRPDLDRQQFAALVKLLVRVSDAVGCVVSPSGRRLTAAGERVLDELQPMLLQKPDEVAEWPGARIIGSRSARRYLYRASESSADVIIMRSAGFSEWVNPMLPEDLHFLRNDGTVVAASIAQHGEAWLELSEEEKSRFAQEAPGLIEQVVVRARRLTDFEVRVLVAIGEASGALGEDELDAFKDTVYNSQVVDLSGSLVRFEPGASVPLKGAKDGILSVEVVVSVPRGEEIGLLHVWVEAGILTAIESSWWTDEPPGVGDFSGLQIHARRNRAAEGRFADDQA